MLLPPVPPRHGGSPAARRRRLRPPPRPSGAPPVLPRDWYIRLVKRDPWLLIGAALILTYVWRFHILAPQVEILRVSAIATLGSWAYLATSARWRQIGKGVRLPFVFFYLAVLAWALLGHPFGISSANTKDQLIGVHLRNLTFLLFLLSVMVSIAHVRLMVWASTAGAAVLVFYYIKSGTPTMWTPVSTYDRNDLALLFNMSVPLVIWLITEARSSWVRIGLVALVAGLGFSVLMSQSRGGFLGLGTILLVYLFSERSIRLRWRLAPLAIGAAGLFLAPPEVKERLSTLTALEQDYNVDSDTGRLEIWKRGWGYAVDSPVFGVGLGNFPVAERLLPHQARMLGDGWKASVAHNTYLEMFAENGFPGAVLYLGLMASLIWILWRERTKHRSMRGLPGAMSGSRLLTALLASSLGYAFGSTFLTTFGLSLLVLLMALAGSAILALRKERARYRAGTIRPPRAARTAPSPGPPPTGG